MIVYIVTFRIFRVCKCKVFVVGVHDSTEGYYEERERLSSDSDTILDRVGNGYRLTEMGGLDRWDRDEVRGD